MSKTCTMVKGLSDSDIDYDALWKQVESLSEEDDDEDEITGMVDLSHIPVSSVDASQEEDDEDEITGMVNLDWN